MKKLILIALMVYSYLLNAQDTSKVQGYSVFNYDNGKISSEGILTDGKPNGYWKTYYETGVLKSEGNRKNFELDSVWKFYTEDGKLLLEINYQRGKKNGIKTTFSEKEIIKENYINDVKEGFTSYLYPNGKLRMSVKFTKGREQGIARELDTLGNVITILEFKNGYLINKEKVNRFNENGLKQGRWVDFYYTGFLKSEGYYKNGIKNGYFKEYSPDGNLLTIEKYVNGELIKDAEEITTLDIKTDYYPNGQIKKKGSYKNNIPEGITREYAQDGKITGSKIFSQGVVIGNGIVDESGLKQGIWNEYYETGELKSTGKYENGYKIGIWKFYHKNGKLEQTGNYLKNQKPDGEWTWFYESGNLLRSETYVGGLLNGPMIEYTDSGTVTAKGEFIDALEEGFWFYHLGDIKIEGNYKEGKREGHWKYIHDNGNLIFEGNYLDDNPDGKHIFYWENGNIKEQGTYVMGNKEGDWLKFNYDGTLFLTITYKNGVEVKYDGVKIKPPFDDKSMN